MNIIKLILCLSLVFILCFIGSSSILAEGGKDTNKMKIELRSMTSTKFKMPLLPANSCDPKIFIPGNPNIDPKIFITP